MNKVSENPLKNRFNKIDSFTVIAVFFTVCYIVSNIMAVKVIGVFGLFYFDAGTITFPLAYMLGDVLTEIWGYRVARKTIILAFLCNVFVVICTQIGVWLPSPDYLDTTATAYNSIIGYLFDTVPFVLIAFIGALTTRDILLMILSQYIIKIAIEALFGTPLAYALIAVLRKKY